jgi:hypothetical protein
VLSGHSSTCFATFHNSVGTVYIRTDRHLNSYTGLGNLPNGSLKQLCTMFAGYVDQLLDNQFNDAIHDPVGFKELSDNIVLPPDLCAANERPVKSEADR